jgi:NTE family protein/lysophospholipid hydrolase
MRGRLGTPLERRRGNGSIIAVDVDVREKLSVDPALQRLSVLRTLKGYVWRNGDGTPSIGSILYRAGHIGGMHERARTMAQADFCLEPPVAEYPLMAYRQAAQIADAGYRYAMKEISRWDHQAIR